MIICALLPRGHGAGVFLNDLTFFPALQNVSKHFNFEYMPLVIEGQWEDGNEVVDKLPDIEDDLIFITTYNNKWTREHYDRIKEKMPKIKTVFLASDTHYDGKTESGSLVGLERIEWPLDLYLDTMKEVVEEAKSKFTSAHYYWSVSQNIIDQIESSELESVKKYDAICLCSTDNQSSVRKEMFQALDEAALWVLRNLDEHDLENIFNLYSQSWITLGTTTSCMSSELRSMKGFRDWIAPFCGSLLIYDSFPDVVEIGSFIPIYRYGDWQGAAKIIKELKDNKFLYNKLIEKQKRWALDNTLEKQLIRIFEEHLL